MNKDELKKKICDIIAPYVSAWGDDERIADALIDANIFVDIDTLKDEQQSMNGILTNMSSYMNYKLHELEHRAARAERALKNFAENITCEDCPFFSDCASSEKMEDLIHSNYCFAEYLRQAEKELAEEEKE